MSREAVPPKLLAVCCAALLLPFAAGCGGDPADSAGGGAGGTGGADVPGGGGGSGGSDGVGGTGGVGAEPEPSEALLFRTTARRVLVDTAGGAGTCGEALAIEGARRRVVIDLDGCGDVDPEAVGVVGSVTVLGSAAESLDVFVAADGAADPGAPHVVGPHGTATHGFLVRLGDDRTLAVEIPGTAAAEVTVEASAWLVPASAGGDSVHLLERPVRWFAANPNDDGFRDVWPRLDTVHRYPVVGAERGATGMFGAVHLGPAVWRDAPVTFHLGAAGPATPANALPRWASAPADAHFPWRYSSFFLSGASAAQEVELRSSSAVEPEWETGIEPWVDAVGFLSPEAGLVYRPLDRPLAFAPVVTENEETVRFETGLAGAAGVVGSATFDLPHWPYDERYRWFFVMVAADPSLFPGALGGGLEGPDWMTAGLNQNGRVTVRFVTRLDEAASFAMRHHSYLSGGPGPGDPSQFLVTADVRIEGVLAAP